MPGGDQASQEAEVRPHLPPELPEEGVDRDLEVCKRMVCEVYDKEKEIAPEIFEKI
jgi:hypothetical protein